MEHDERVELKDMSLDAILDMVNKDGDEHGMDVSMEEDVFHRTFTTEDDVSVNIYCLPIEFDFNEKMAEYIALDEELSIVDSFYATLVDNGVLVYSKAKE